VGTIISSPKTRTLLEKRLTIASRESGVPSSLSIPKKIMTKKVIASTGKQRAEPIEAYLARRITP
jgi:hypothetical protein